MSAPIPPSQLRAILDRKPESLAGRIVRELANEPGIGGRGWLAVLLIAVAAIGFIIATGGKF